jgi:hypothetical protein
LWHFHVNMYYNLKLVHLFYFSSFYLSHLLMVISTGLKVRSPKDTCFLPYVEYRPNTNTAILWRTCHAKGRSHIREGGYKKEINKINIIDVFSIQERI